MKCEKGATYKTALLLRLLKIQALKTNRRKKQKRFMGCMTKLPLIIIDFAHLETKIKNKHYVKKNFVLNEFR